MNNSTTVSYQNWPPDFMYYNLVEDPTAISNLNQDVYTLSVNNVLYQVVEEKTRKFGTYRFFVPTHMWNRSVDEDVIFDQGEAIACTGCVCKDWFIDTVPKYEMFKSIVIQPCFIPQNEKNIIEEVEYNGGHFRSDYIYSYWFSADVDDGNPYFFDFDYVTFNALSKEERLAVYKAIDDITDVGYVLDGGSRSFDLNDVLSYINNNRGGYTMPKDNIYARTDSVQLNITEEPSMGCVRYDYASETYGLYTFLFPHIYWDTMQPEVKSTILSNCHNLAAYGNEQHSWTLEELMNFMSNPSYATFPSDANGVSTSLDPQQLEPNPSALNPFVNAVVEGLKSGAKNITISAPPCNKLPEPTTEYPKYPDLIKPEDMEAAAKSYMLDLQQDVQGFRKYRNDDDTCKAKNAFLVARAYLVGDIVGHINDVNSEVPVVTGQVPIAIRPIDCEPVVPVGNTDPAQNILLGYNSVPMVEYQDYVNLNYAFEKMSGEQLLTHSEAAAIAANYIYARDSRLIEVLNDRNVLNKAVDGRELTEDLSYTRLANACFPGCAATEQSVSDEEYKNAISDKTS